MKRLFLPAVLIIIIGGLFLTVGYLLAGRHLGLPVPEIVTRPQISAHAVVKEAVNEYAWGIPGIRGGYNLAFVRGVPEIPELPDPCIRAVTPD
jgi:hypothetical protein